MTPFSQRLLAGAVLAGVFLTGSVVNAQIADGSSATANLRLASNAAVNVSYVQTVHEKLQWSLQTEEEIAQEEAAKEKAAAEKREQVKRQLALAAQAKAEAEAKEKEKAAAVAAQKAAQQKAAQAKQVAQAASTPVSRGESSNNNIVQNALSLQGIPYVFGGMSLKGFDCSGFTKYVFSVSGITLSRSSFEQYASGTSVSKSQLEPGDLVFFSTYSSGASHVGIYIGAGQFVHASNSGVRITSLSDSYYAARYMGARRYF